MAGGGRAALVSDLQSKEGERGDPRRPRGRRRLCGTRTSGTEQQRGKVDAWWVLKDNPVLSGTDIKNPEQTFDRPGRRRAHRQMKFTGKGQKAFADTTPAIARRGADNAASTAA